MADIDVRWPAPPYRLSALTGGAGRLLQACALFLLLAGLPLVLGGIEDLAFPDPILADRPLFDRSWPPLLLVLIGAGLLLVARRAWREGRGRRVAAGAPKSGRIIEVDILAGHATGRAGVAWVYAATLDGQRLYRRELRGNAVLALDDLQTRGAALMVDGAAAVLLMPGLAPILPDAVAEADIARRAAAGTVRPGHRLHALEDSLPAGPQRDVVRLYREAAEATGRRRARLIWQRLKAAHRLDWEVADRLLQECRRHATP